MSRGASAALNYEEYVMSGTHIDLIGCLCRMYHRPRYLEIGLGDGFCFMQASSWSESAHGVDVPSNPYGAALVRARVEAQGKHCFYYEDGSDAFFENYAGQAFDLIFIDGSHWEEQVQRDWEHAVGMLALNGTIILHDTWAATLDEALQGSDTAYRVAERIEADPNFQAFTIPLRPGITLARPNVARFS